MSFTHFFRADINWHVEVHLCHQANADAKRIWVWAFVGSILPFSSAYSCGPVMAAHGQMALRQQTKPREGNKELLLKFQHLVSTLVSGVKEKNVFHIMGIWKIPKYRQNYNILVSCGENRWLGVCFSHSVAELEQPGDVRSDIIFMGNWDVCDETICCNRPGICPQGNWTELLST